MKRRTILAAIAALTLIPGMGIGNEAVLGASQARQAMEDGKLILVDIRRPDEWAQTGVAAGAWPLDMRARDFGTKLLAIIERNPDREVAVICRTGNRSGYLVDVLKKNDIHGVLDVSEGMAGGRNGTGWIPSGLPIVSASEALDGMPGDFQAD